MTTDPTAAHESDANTVANRAAQVITRMGADIRALTGERDRYRTAWRSARERAQAYGEGILRVVKDREQYQEWLRQAEERAAAVSVPPPADQTATWLDAAAECNKAAGAYAEHGHTDTASAVFALMEAFLRKAANAEYVATPCDFAACEPGGEPCSVHERLMGHAEGDHELCAPDCGAEWERRVAATDAVLAVLPEQTDRGAVLLEAADFLRDAHFRDGMSVQEIGTAMRHWADRERPAVGEQPETQEKP